MTTSRFLQLLDRHHKKTLWLAIALATVAVSAVLAWKYFSFGYNAIDLGIYNQVFYNSAHGRLFQFSIHPHLYLGDHMELFLVLLLPLYALYQSPLTLLVLQAAAIMLTAWPLFLIARRWLSIPWSLGVALAFLVNPFAINMAFFEFHMLPFAMPVLAAVFLAYQRERLRLFFAISVMALTIREDVSLVIMMFGILALVERRSWRWIIPPFVVGALWLVGATLLAGHLNPTGSYKFIALYSWLGSSQSEIIRHALTQPWLVLRQLLSVNNFFLAAGLLIPLIGLPLLRARYLLPALLVALQLFLTQVSATIVLQTHYPALILPFVFIAAAAGLQSLNQATKLTRLKSFIIGQKQVFSIILVVAILYSFVTFSPAIAVVQRLFQHNENRGVVGAEGDGVATVSPSDSVVASFSFLPALSNREHLYSLHYAFLGKKQYSTETYAVPAGVDRVLIDFNDFLIYYLQSKSITSYVNQYATGGERIRQLLADQRLGLTSITDTVAVYGKNQLDAFTLSSVVSEIPATATTVSPSASPDELVLAAWEAAPFNGTVLATTLFWNVNRHPSDDYALLLTLADPATKKTFRKYYPLGYGLLPTSDWNTGEMVQTNYWFAIPEKFQTPTTQVAVQVMQLRGYMGLDGVGSASMVITRSTPATPQYSLSGF